jgi:hypothetical protein
MPAVSPARLARLRPAAALLLLALGVLAAAPRPAEAAFAADGRGSATVHAHSVSRGHQPTLLPDRRDVATTWDPAVVGDAPVDGYTLRRYAQGSGTATVVSADCRTAETSCLDRAVPPGTWEYTVTPFKAGWRGEESERVPAEADPPP